MKKIIKVLKEVLLYFVIVLLISWAFNKFGWIDNSIIEFAICLTIGWCIWKIISYLFHKAKNKEVI